MTEKTLVLAGATGLVGAAALEAALAGGWRVAALVRAGRQLQARQNLETLSCDFDALDALAPRLSALAPAAFVCALGTTIRTAGSQAAFARVDRDYVASFAALGVSCGATGFALVSSVGADAGSSNFYLRTKGEAEQAIRAAGFAHVEIFRPSFLMGERAEHRLGERLAIPVARVLSPLLAGPLSIYRPIPAGTVGRALIAGVSRDEAGVFVRHYDEIARLASA
jgi:uncharacterized protein YbjT (DUF2867 family)